LLRLAVAAKRLGVHSGTLRIWADEGAIPFSWVGVGKPELRFDEADLDVFAGRASAPVRERVEVAYVHRYRDGHGSSGGGGVHG
jgi:excisionase family DNA binding protein